MGKMKKSKHWMDDDAIPAIDLAGQIVKDWITGAGIEPTGQ